MLYNVFRFDYIGYQKLIEPITKAIDIENYAPLYAQAQIVVNNLSGKWILEDKGTMLESVEIQNKPGNVEIGYWLLVLLSSFLHPAKPTLTKPASIAIGLQVIGWKPDEISRLVYGENIAEMARTQSYSPLTYPLHESDSYWHWIRPTQANKSGWLSIERINSLKEKLLASQKLFYEIETSSLPNKIAKEDVLGAYSTSLEMLTSSIEMGEGIYIIFS